MNIWELPKEYYNWESPITKVYGDIHNEIIRQDEENYICAIEQAIGYRVDKDELIKALQYDREQYDKGYKDGVRETFVEELEKIIDKINFEEKWLINVKMDNGFISIADIEIAMSGIRSAISKLKGENE